MTSPVGVSAHGKDRVKSGGQVYSQVIVLLFNWETAEGQKGFNWEKRKVSGSGDGPVKKTFLVVVALK